jgi:hypothetical protein
MTATEYWVLQLYRTIGFSHIFVLVAPFNLLCFFQNDALLTRHIISWLWIGVECAGVGLEQSMAEYHAWQGYGFPYPDFAFVVHFSSGDWDICFEL